MFRRMAFLLSAICLTTAAVSAAPQGLTLPPQPSVRPAGIPSGYVMVTPCLPGMGEHWANLQDLGDPIYGTYRGKVIFTELMVPKAALDKGINYPDLAALPGHTIDHLQIEWEPQGHPGMSIPHYDFHLYYISPAAVDRVCR